MTSRYRGPSTTANTLSQTCHMYICPCLYLRPSHELALAYTSARPSPPSHYDGHTTVKTVSVRNKPPPLDHHTIKLSYSLQVISRRTLRRLACHAPSRIGVVALYSPVLISFVSSKMTRIYNFVHIDVDSRISLSTSSVASSHQTLAPL